jgi:hypothetical protein
MYDKGERLGLGIAGEVRDLDSKSVGALRRRRGSSRTQNAGCLTHRKAGRQWGR